jgi:hypothetical protein
MQEINLKYYPDICLDGLKKITNETLFTIVGVLTEVTANTISSQLLSQNFTLRLQICITYR